MNFQILINGIIIGMSASIPLGPIGILCIQKTINKGHFAGMVAGAGAAFADTFYAVIAGFGVTFITNFIEEQQIYIKIIGGIILLILGYRIFSTNPAIQIRKNRNNNNFLTDFFAIFILTLSNPMTIFFFGAAFAGFGIVREQSNWAELLQLIGGVFLGAAAWWFILTTFVNIFRKKFRLKRLWWINKIAGSLVILFGVFVIISLFFIKF
ncbi:MAG: lysine transporter LysE [Bacteroidetes bacterium HGW-Bacteroidetes-21]|jgi:threonine/homoserine/homoserine lactone efflux protein|nr:MAG: lysine transporter LysE [Bacteroidetes bacterium HGW-Bacteroidetes-21]